MVGVERARVAKALKERGEKRCWECGENIPLHALICPFCYYGKDLEGDENQDRYDHSSSPYLIMADLNGYAQAAVEMQPLSLFVATLRWLLFLNPDPRAQRVLEIDTTFGIIRETIIYRYSADEPSVVEVMEEVESLYEQCYLQRCAVVDRARRIGRGVVVVTVVAVVVILALIFS